MKEESEFTAGVNGDGDFLIMEGDPNQKVSEIMKENGDRQTFFAIKKITIQDDVSIEEVEKVIDEEEDYEDFRDEVKERAAKQFKEVSYEG